MDTSLSLHLHNIVDQISTITALKWLLLVVICVIVTVMMFWELRKMQRYYHRLTSAATSQDTAALDYSLKLLSRLSRSIFLLCMAFIILTFSIITIDIKRHHLTAMRTMMEDKSWCNNTPPPPSNKTE